MEFYLGFLGFTLDWQHRFGDNFPLYAQVSRASVILHLSEHHGDACPGAAVMIHMRGIDDYHRELTARDYRYAKPGIEAGAVEDRACCVSPIPSATSSPSTKRTKANDLCHPRPRRSACLPRPHQGAVPYPPSAPWPNASRRLSYELRILRRCARPWGEVWSNFPTASAEHRALLFAEYRGATRARQVAR